MQPRNGFSDGAWALRRPNRSHTSKEPPIQAELEFPDDGSQLRPEDDEYLIKGILVRRSVGTLVGGPGTGKTTFALDLGFAIAGDSESYHGRRIRNAAVLYVGYEGDTGIRNRIAAAFRKHGNPHNRFARLLLPETLNKEQGERGVQQVVAACRRLEEQCGEPVGIIIIDTKSRATAGDDEDNNSDAAVFMEKRLKPIAQQTGAAVLVLHHPGKDIDRGGRGASANKGGDDFTILLKRQGDQRTVFLDKVRDGEDQINWFHFTVESVPLRVDGDGQTVTAGALKSQAQPVQTKAGKTNITPQSRMALDALLALYNDGKAKRVSPSLLDGADVPRAVTLESWREACRSKGLTAGHDDPKKKVEAERKAFQRVREDLYAAHLIGSNENYAWLTGQAGHAGRTGTDGDIRPAGPTRSGRDGQGHTPIGVSLSVPVPLAPSRE